MSEIKVNSIKGVAASTAALTINNTDGTCTANITSINGGQISGRKNLVTNGEMTVCQRAGTTSTAVTNEHEFVLDRFMVSTANGGGTSLNVQQLHGNPTGAPYGFAASMKMTVAIADDGGADSFNVVQTRIENLDTNYLAFGTSQAKTVTLSFHVKSSLTGTFGGALVSGDFSRGNVFQYTISSADTWEKKTVTIVGDTTSTADSVYNRGSATSLNGLTLYFDLGSGSNNEKSAANSWAATGVNAYGSRIAGNVKLCANAGADWSITGIQLEEGSVATDFEHRSFGEELALCQRYYYQVTKQGDTGTVSNAPIGLGNYDSSSNMQTILQFPVQMRTNPSVVSSDTTNGFYIRRENAADFFDNFTLSYSTKNCARIFNSSDVSGSAGACGNILQETGDSNLAFNAEL